MDVDVVCCNSDVLLCVVRCCALLLFGVAVVCGCLLLCVLLCVVHVSCNLLCDVGCSLFVVAWLCLLLPRHVVDCW